MWNVETRDGKSINLRDIFRTNFFTFKLPIQRDNDGFVKPADDSDRKSGFYPLRARFDNQIPLEYIWASKDKLTDDWADSGAQYWEVQNYRWYNSDEREDRITAEEIGLLGEKLCHALHHVESAAGNQNGFLGKEPISVPNLPVFTLGESSLARSLNDYLDLEYYSDKQEKYRHYARSPRERVLSGYAAIFEVTRTEFDENEVRIYGNLIYNRSEFTDPERVAYSSRIRGSAGSSSGSYRLLNEVSWNNEQGMHSDSKSTPKQIESGLPVIIQEFDAPNRNILVQSSTFNTPENFSPNKNRDWYNYVARHDTWVRSEQEAGTDWGLNNIYPQKGERYILDRQTDNWTGNHAEKVLREYRDESDGSAGSYLYNTIERMLEASENE